MTVWEHCLQRWSVLPCLTSINFNTSSWMRAYDLSPGRYICIEFRSHILTAVSGWGLCTDAQMCVQCVSALAWQWSRCVSILVSECASTGCGCSYSTSPMIWGPPQQIRKASIFAGWQSVAGLSPTLAKSLSLCCVVHEGRGQPLSCQPEGGSLFCV